MKIYNILLCVYAASFSSRLTGEEPSSITFTDTKRLLTTIDTIIGVNGWAIAQLMQFRKILVDLLYGKPVKSMQGVKGAFKVDDSSYTLEQLVTLEQQLAQQSPPHATITPAHYAACLAEAQQLLKKNLLPLLRILQRPELGDKGMPAIMEWATQHQRSDSLLCIDWKDKNDNFFDRHVDSFLKLHQLCLDFGNYVENLFDITACESTTLGKSSEFDLPSSNQVTEPHQETEVAASFEELITAAIPDINTREI